MALEFLPQLGSPFRVSTRSVKMTRRSVVSLPFQNRGFFLSVSTSTSLLNLVNVAGLIPATLPANVSSRGVSGWVEPWTFSRLVIRLSRVWRQAAGDEKRAFSRVVLKRRLPLRCWSSLWNVMVARVSKASSSSREAGTGIFLISRSWKLPVTWFWISFLNRWRGWTGEAQDLPLEGLLLYIRADGGISIWDQAYWYLVCPLLVRDKKKSNIAQAMYGYRCHKLSSFFICQGKNNTADNLGHGNGRTQGMDHNK